MSYKTARIDELVLQVAQDATATALDPLGELIDASSDSGDENGLKAAIAWSDSIEANALTPKQRLQLHYYIGSAWLEASAQAIRTTTRPAADWEQPELEKAVLYLRRVISSPDFETWHRIRRAQTFTNLGNALSTLGRSIDAIQMRDEAIVLIPTFAMALGTRAQTLHALGSRLTSKTQRLSFLQAAADGFNAASDESAFFETTGYDEVKARWAVLGRDLSAFCDRNRADVPPMVVMQTPPQVDEAYGAWCVQERLRLNSMNDLGATLAANIDCAHLPPIARLDDRAKWLFGYFDTIAQEYSVARRLTYESLMADMPYVSEIQNVHDTGDFPIFGLAAEKLKLGFRTAYSIFDKIAFLLSMYFKIGLNAREISFSQVWRDKKKQFRAGVASSTNWSLRGLYWISRDLSEEPYRDTIEPESRDLATIRNYLEHRYLKVVQEDTPIVITDELLVISLNDLQRKTRRMLRLARTAILTMINAIAEEEKQRGPGRGDLTSLPRLTSERLRFETEQ